MEGSLFVRAFIYLTAAVVAVPIAKRLGLGSVLGYLIAGVLIGPFALDLVGSEGQDVMHFAEFGVVLMLFLVGLELEPALLWRMRVPVLGLGGLQVTLTAGAITGIGMALGLPWQQALAIGLTLALSSTAIVLQTLAEKGWLQTGGGQSAFAVLLFQDIAVIPMLAVMPLLATRGVGVGHGEDAHAHETWVSGLPAWAQTLAVLAAVASIVVCGRYLLRPAFRFIARANLREVFVAAALLLVVGIALLMQQVGLSPALGTFVAGVVLATSEYRHQLEADIEPFKGLLLGLFFLAVGASIDFELIASAPGTVGGLVLGLILVKLLLLLGLGRVFRMGTDQGMLFAFALAQGGEFAFVLFSFAEQSGVLPSELGKLLIVVVAVTMALTPLLVLLFENVIMPRVGTKEADDRPYDEMEGGNPVIIAGYGRFGQIVGRLLAAEGVEATVLEADSDQVELLRRFGRRVFYGDATRMDLLRAAGAAEAKLLVLALDRPEKNRELLGIVKEEFPGLKVLSRARGRIDAYQLVQDGCDLVFRETFDSAVRLGTEALVQLGRRRYRSHRAAQRFRRHDEELLRELAKSYGDDNFMSIVRTRNEEVAKVLEQGPPEAVGAGDAGWDSSALIKEKTGAA
ncbi:MAG: monovalent cation:proton antiporter-2 (CPA2) family protein [Myxococcota bacterium]